MGKPNFFIIGSAKCGTTSLASLLSENPSVYFTNPKETKFFSVNYHKGIPFYENKYFRKVNHPLAGEGDVSYFSNPKVAGRIAKHYPEAKIIVLLRNPIHRAFSAYLMGVRAGRFKKPFMETLGVNLEQLKLFEEEEELKFFFPHENIYTSKVYFQIITKFSISRKWEFLRPIKRIEKKIRKKIFLPKKPVLEPCAEEFLYHYYKKRVQNLKCFLNDDIKEWSIFDRTVEKRIDV